MCDACNALYYNLHLYHLQEPLAKQVTIKLLLLLLLLLKLATLY